jgi:hypothetical protein
MPEIVYNNGYVIIDYHEVTGEMRLFHTDDPDAIVRDSKLTSARLSPDEARQAAIDWGNES